MNENLLRSLPDPFTTLLLHGDGTNNAKVFTDEIGATVALSGDIVTSTTAKKFGTASLATVSTKAGTLSVSKKVIPTDQSDFTIEFFLNCTTFKDGAAYKPFEYGILSVIFNPGSNSVETRLNLGTSIVYIQTTTANFINKFGHYAIVRKSGVYSVYNNGVKVSNTLSYATALAQSTVKLFNIDSWLATKYPSLFYMDEFRISNIARYSANFTPPTSAFVVD